MITTIKDDLIIRLVNAVKRKCPRVARARIRDLAKYCKEHEGIEESATIKYYTQRFIKEQ